LRRTLLFVLMVLYVLMMLDMTLRWYPENHPAANLVPFRSMVHDVRVGGREFVVNFVGNLVAFMPLGVLLPSLSVRWGSARRVALAGAIFSAAIESTQYLSGRRVADVDDVLLNTTGALLGYLVYRAARPRGEG
jgi:glycopeptide antibiotics resistance protein